MFPCFWGLNRCFSFAVVIRFLQKKFLNIISFDIFPYSWAQWSLFENTKRSVFDQFILDAIASPSSYPCQWVVSGVMLSHLRALCSFYIIMHHRKSLQYEKPNITFCFFTKAKSQTTNAMFCNKKLKTNGLTYKWKNSTQQFHVSTVFIPRRY